MLRRLQVAVTLLPRQSATIAFLSGKSLSLNWSSTVCVLALYASVLGIYVVEHRCVNHGPFMRWQQAVYLYSTDVLVHEVQSFLTRLGLLNLVCGDRKTSRSYMPSSTGYNSLSIVNRRFSISGCAPVALVYLFGGRRSIVHLLTVYPEASLRLQQLLSFPSWISFYI